MALGDFAKHIQPKVAKMNCESCGQGGWTLIEDVGTGEVPITTFIDPANVKIPPTSFPTILMVCNNCHYVRTYMVPNNLAASQGGGAGT